MHIMAKIQLQVFIRMEPVSNLIPRKANRLSYAGVRPGESSLLVNCWLVLSLCECVHQGKVQGENLALTSNLLALLSMILPPVWVVE